MHTVTNVVFGDASSMSEVDDESVHLVVTSPPYPMIEMWDELFADQHPAIGRVLDAGDGQLAFQLMHDVLRPVWKECFRALVDGGILCINIGDATRTIGGQFQLFPNHAEIISRLVEIGFAQLPGILWRKPTNSLTKFMGAGMLGLNAYVTLEHEHILIFRKGTNRATSEEEKQRRAESAYFWEERNRWFSDVWTDLPGARQAMENGHGELRWRSAAFPLELPLRLIEMYSIYGDTVVDPFWGTGTTSVAAAMLARSSIGYEKNPRFWPLFEERIEQVPVLSKNHNAERLTNHVRFIDEHRRAGKPPRYINEHYGFGVVTSQERKMKLYDVASVERVGKHLYRCSYEPHVFRQKTHRA